jgi:tetratricopeptide (TPR) repeat protein
MPCPSENSLLDFVAGDASPDATAALETHFDDCAMCRRVVADAAKQLRSTTLPREAASGGTPAADLERLTRGDGLDRYLILERVGAGAMGVVYAAYDPRLDRRVALKLLRPSVAAKGKDKAQLRLLQEARAVAQLSDPHVVSVYDAGTVDGHVYVAMEYVEGTTLKAYLAERKRPWAEVLELLRAAGRGLAAAHAAGLVHRDFKPENILIGKGGRVVVTDFGLARSAALEGGDPGALPALTPAVPSFAAQDLTRTGTTVGTPAYMAPEQWRGQTVDARTDQFSFCVTAYEALFGRRPFDATTLEALREQMLGGQVNDAHRSVRLPHRVREAILRGLSPDPTQRHRSMNVLLPLLDAARGKRTFFRVAAAVVGVVVALASTALLWNATRLPICASGHERLAAAWGPERKEVIRQALLGTRRSFAKTAWVRTERVLNAFASDWRAMQQQTCEGGQLRAEISRDRLYARAACLERALTDLNALTHVLAQADGRVVERAVEAASGLTPVTRCDSALVGGTQELPATGRKRREVDAGRRQLAEAAALMESGHYADGLSAALAAEKKLEATGFDPAQAEALELIGRLKMRLGQHVEAVEDLREAIYRAQSAGDDRTALRANISLLGIFASDPGKREEATLWTRQAHAMLRRIGGDEVLEAKLLTNEGVRAVSEGDYPRARQLLTKALRLKRETLGPRHPSLAYSLNVLGATALRQGQLDEGLRSLHEALALREGALGPDHPDVAMSLANLAGALFDHQRCDEALPLARRALAIREVALGASHLETAQSLRTLGFVLECTGEDVEGAQVLARAVGLQEALLGALHLETARTRPTFATTLARQGELAGARAQLEMALEAQRASWGAESVATVGTHAQLARLMAQQGELRAALAEALRARRIAEKDAAAHGPSLGYALHQEAEIRLLLGQRAKAQVALERAQKLLPAQSAYAQERFEVFYALARIAAQRRDVSLALAWGQEALAVLPSGKGVAAKQAREVGAWLETLRGAQARQAVSRRTR